MGNLHWKTKITKIEPNKISLRGTPIDELMGNLTFSQAIYLALKGEMPDERVGKLMDTILVSSIDHGATPPSILTARTVASTGAPLNACIAAGILAISKYHGGAIEGCMEVILKVKEIAEKENLCFASAALKHIQYLRTQKIRISGFGHRIHTQDPRTIKLFSVAKESGFYGDYVEIALAIESGIEETLGKKLPINVDGAIAAILCELGFSSEIANAFFIMSRVVGMTAHTMEEKSMKIMRKIHPTDHEYVE